MMPQASLLLAMMFVIYFKSPFSKDSEIWCVFVSLSATMALVRNPTYQRSQALSTESPTPEVATIRVSPSNSSGNIGLYIIDIRNGFSLVKLLPSLTWKYLCSTLWNGSSMPQTLLTAVETTQHIVRPEAWVLRNFIWDLSPSCFCDRGWHAEFLHFPPSRIPPSFLTDMVYNKSLKKNVCST